MISSIISTLYKKNRAYYKNDEMQSVELGLHCISDKYNVCDIIGNVSTFHIRQNTQMYVTSSYHDRTGKIFLYLLTFLATVRFRHKSLNEKHAT